MNKYNIHATYFWLMYYNLTDGDEYAIDMIFVPPPFLHEQQLHDPVHVSEQITVQWKNGSSPTMR